MRNATAKERKQIRNEVESGVGKILADKVTFKKDNTISFKKSFFYKRELTAKKFSDRIYLTLTEMFPELNFTAEDQTERWNAWPKDSYFEAKFSIQQ